MKKLIQNIVGLWVRRQTLKKVNQIRTTLGLDKVPTIPAGKHGDDAEVGLQVVLGAAGIHVLKYDLGFLRLADAEKIAKLFRVGVLPPADERVAKKLNFHYRVPMPKVITKYIDEFGIKQ